ncbi:reverse transcriptase domain-containing protein, partial [Yersinia alsatica]|uniref:reverse transcriptase domain-containing protein n=1 Tax=Yersinia alsatica TaxID=2890317 RepID=UPI0011A8AE94
YNRYIKIDLSKFYPSIPQERLLKKLKEKIKKKELLNLIEKAISTGTSSHGGRKQKNNEGVPQGLSISNILAEIYLMNLDSEMIKKTNLYYSRYVDDILILCREDDIPEISKRIIDDIKSLGLTPHGFNSDSKSKIGNIDSDNFEFLGYNFFDSKLTPKKTSILRFENNIAGVLTSFKYKFQQAKKTSEKKSAIALCQWKLNLKITGCIHKNTRLGWVFYFSQTNCSTPFRQIDSTIKALIKKLNLTNIITTKKVLKAFYESSVGNKNQHKYIINFDRLTISDKRDILSLYLNPSKVITMPDDLVIKMFERRLRDSIKDLEKDIGHNS